MIGAESTKSSFVGLLLYISFRLFIFANKPLGMAVAITRVPCAAVLGDYSFVIVGNSVCRFDL